MLIDELRLQLKNTEPALDTIKAYWKHAGVEKRLSELEQKSNEPDFWQKPELGKELQKLRLQQEQYHYIIQTSADMSELLDLFENDEKELQKIKSEVTRLYRTITTFKIDLLLNQPEDDSHCFLSINSGAGGTESQDWANILMRMFLRFCEREKFTTQVVDYQPAEEAGIKSATLFIKGKKAYGFLKSEHGIHRLVRISPFDANKRRHTSFAGVMVTPEAPEIDVTIDPKDLRIDTYRAGGAGGQHVNKTESAVRITHIPTNIVVQCQNERSQGQNKETAMKMLRARLGQRLKEEQEAKLTAGVEKKKIEWGSQIRSYILHPYKMVKDHRTDFESSQPDLVLDGELMDFIESYLVWLAREY
ncbi:MAG: peptide chain release factor 2 [bacterium]|nr:peptide chain release factor 2 [bacterium]